MDTNKILIGLLIVILLIMLFQTHVTIIHPQPLPPPKPIPVPVPVPNPIVVKPIGGCAGTRYGCCPNGVTARWDAEGSNC
jgi:hypothetical protein